MSKSETSFVQRIHKTDRLLAAAAGFIPAYEPADSGLLLAAVTAVLANAEPLNAAVADAITAWSAVVQERRAQIALIKARGTLLINYLRSNPAWATSLPRAKLLADAIRDIRPRVPGSSARQRCAQSCSQIEGNWQSLTALAIGLPGYAPPATNTALQPAALTALHTHLTTLNEAIATHEETLSTLRQQRLDAYNGPDGLKEKFKGLKQAIKGQYGHTSTQFLQIKSLRW